MWSSTPVISASGDQDGRITESSKAAQTSTEFQASLGYGANAVLKTKTKKPLSATNVSLSLGSLTVAWSPKSVLCPATPVVRSKTGVEGSSTALGKGCKLFT